jgi:hypothetical protein
MHDGGKYGDAGSIHGGRNGQDFNFNSGKTYGVQIDHGQSAAFNTASTTYVDVSRADRGPEYVESNDDSGQRGPSSPYSDNNNVARGSVPPIMRNRGR